LRIANVVVPATLNQPTISRRKRLEFIANGHDYAAAAK
jgi:hypothetical protein